MTLNNTYQAGRPHWPSYFMMTYGFGWAVAANVGVLIYLSEAIAFLGLFLVPWRRFLSEYPIASKILASYSLWALAIIVSDLVNDTDLLLSVKNLSTPVIGGFGFLFVFTCLAREPKSILAFLLGIAVGKMLLGDPFRSGTFEGYTFSIGSVAQDTNFFKVRFEPFLTPFFTLLSVYAYRRSPRLAVFLLYAVSIFYFSLDARSMGLAFFVAGAILFAVNIGFRPRLSHILILGFLITLLGYLCYVVYVNHTLSSNIDGHNGQQLQRLANPYNPLRLLIEGRSEWVVMPMAALEKPIFGWGSWAIDEGNRFAYIRFDLLSHGLAPLPGNEEGLIPAHSVIGSAWLWSGMFGLFAMIWLFRIIQRTALAALKTETPLMPAMIVMTLTTLWFFFFNPPQSVRLYFPVPLACLTVLSHKAIYGTRLKSSRVD